MPWGSGLTRFELLEEKWPGLVAQTRPANDNVLPNMVVKEDSYQRFLKAYHEVDGCRMHAAGVIEWRKADLPGR